ncbi:MAG: SNF2-related protein [Acidobacteria bacterium]|nr:SNF2-related protein [Acidobacteriota bacterium]
MPSDDCQFRVGEVVQRVNQPEAVGVVAEVRRDPQTGACICVIEFPGERRAVPQNAIRRFEPSGGPWDDLAKNHLSGHEHFVFALTFHRLRHPPSRIARSFATARTLFYPHQFRPVLKFLENPGKRLLIADDVGLGKTIEAGYILRELDLRQGRLERILVVVPARLAPKWKRELRNRFDESFEVIKGTELIGQAEKLRRGREIDAFRWIVSYESARSEEVRLALEETQLPMDLWIADEAHRMRNPETLQHKLGMALCRCADNILFLSATPVLTGLDNLWYLLRLLSPEEFREWPVFEEQMRANRLLLTAQRALGQRPADFQAARQAWTQFSNSPPIQAGPTTEFTRSVDSRLQNEGLERRDVSELQGDIGLLSPTAHIISRTRKVEALPNCPKRDAGWLLVRLTDEEREIYESVQQLCSLAWGPQVTSWGFQMSLLMAYRITASCIPAALAYFEEKLRQPTSPTEAEGLEIDEDDAEGPQEEETVWTLRETRERLQHTLDSYARASLKDSKFEKLVETLEKIWLEDKNASRDRRKIVLFSYFRRTLEHLAQSLRKRGYENVMIHGRIPVDERELAIDEFLDRVEIPVLLTSDVGGEGIDLQKACVVINYDLPWNPMVVEQRIGRVDRIGQESPIIYILNFVVERSVEQRILQRLLARIRIFEESIGELDAIIGNEIEELAAKALRGELIGAELEDAVQRTEDALAMRVNEAKRLLSQVDGLLASDQALIDEINAVAGERQIPTERELLLFLNRFLAQRYPGCQLPEETSRHVVSIDLHGPLALDIERKASDIGEDALFFSRRIATGSASITLSREAAYRHPRTELVHVHHPLCRFAVSELQGKEGYQGAAFSLTIPPGCLPAGEYAFLLAFFHIPTYRPTNKMVAIVVSRDGRTLYTEPEETTRILLEVLERGKHKQSTPLSEVEFETIKRRLLDGLHELKTQWDIRERKMDQARRDQQYASQAAGYDYRLSRAKDRLERLSESSAQEFAIRMARAQLAKAKRELETFQLSKPRTEWPGIETEELAVGLLRVQAGV